MAETGNHGDDADVVDGDAAEEACSAGAEAGSGNTSSRQSATHGAKLPCRRATCPLCMQQPVAHVEDQLRHAGLHLPLSSAV